VQAPQSSFAGFRFPPEVIILALRWYLRYSLSYRDVEELLAERGIAVDHVTIYRWVQRFTPELIDAARPSRHVTGDRWFVDETYLKVAGQWVYLYRAIDQHGQVIDVLASPKRGAVRAGHDEALDHDVVGSCRDPGHHGLAVSRVGDGRVAGAALADDQPVGQLAGEAHRVTRPRGRHLAGTNLRGVRASARVTAPGASSGCATSHVLRSVVIHRQWATLLRCIAW
jgi:hypothetical protein